MMAGLGTDGPPRPDLRTAVATGASLGHGWTARGQSALRALRVVHVAEPAELHSRGVVAAGRVGIFRTRLDRCDAERVTYVQ
jgi:hypothetical protein